MEGNDDQGTQQERGCPHRLTRRSFVEATGGAAICALVLPLLQGCEVVEIRGDTDVPTALAFDLTAPEYQGLEMVGGVAAVDAGALAILLIRDAEGSIIALDRICPHNQTDMAPEAAPGGTWDQEAQVLTCNLHLAKYSETGAVVQEPLGGGETQPLNRYRVEFDQSAGTGTVFLTETVEA